MKLVDRVMLAALLALPASALAQKVSVDAEKDVDFSKYHTYSYAPGRPAKNPGVDTRIVESLRAHLASEGLTKDDGAPDLLVTYYGAPRSEMTVDTNSSTYRDDMLGRGSQPPKLMHRMLVVDISDAKTKEIVWRGIASDSIPDNPDQGKELLDRAMQKLFDRYPPVPKAAKTDAKEK